ncbi:MAG: succinate dehydrogenase, cytochrome b556 subunit [Dehalococcoidia bacterium]|jgi:succinate dehydrogenase / fumarate reductase cytochrome b subunit|nr:succinate dehydrogenase, cytochrome b556 subunit [Dehalococcoidia bacterium]MDP7240713.1 succinate dehydrogenase, cytochrome b556 subunit [Dehalococcoidia bacterium]
MMPAYRSRKVMGGMGAVAFAMHRASGVVIALYGITHVLVMSYALGGDVGFNRLMETFQQPWVLVLEMLLVAVVLFHMLNGVRILLFDIGVGVRHQKALFIGLMTVGAVVLVLTVLDTLPWLQGRELV